MIRRAAPLAPLASLAAVGVAACGGKSTVGTSSQPASLPGTTTVAGGSLRSGSFTGQTAQTRYGPVDVAVTIAGGRITGVSFLALPSDRARSQEISSQAAPLPREEALQAQSAEIDLLSGASYTSEGFAESLQSALAAARQ